MSAQDKVRLSQVWSGEYGGVTACIRSIQDARFKSVAYKMKQKKTTARVHIDQVKMRKNTEDIQSERTGHPTLLPILI